MQRSYLRGLQYEREKKKTFNIENLKQNTESAKTAPSEKTARRLAEQHKVSDRTIYTDTLFAGKLRFKIGKPLGGRPCKFVELNEP